MPNKDFKFNLREPSGSMGDFGTLFPLVIGLVYRLPMPVEPKKIVAAAAIAQRWPASLVYASGLGLGITWFILVLTGLMRRIVRWTPSFIVRGIQLALGIMLAWEGIKMIWPKPWLGAFAFVIVLLLRENRHAPATLVLMALGVRLIAWQGRLEPAVELSITLPPLTIPRWDDVWRAMLLAGLAQIPLSITNAVIATAALIRDYFPDRAVDEERLMLNMGLLCNNDHWCERYAVVMTQCAPR